MNEENPKYYLTWSNMSDGVEARGKVVGLQMAHICQGSVRKCTLLIPFSESDEHLTFLNAFSIIDNGQNFNGFASKYSSGFAL